MKNRTYGGTARGKCAHHARLKDFRKIANDVAIILFRDTAADFLETGIRPTQFDVINKIPAIKKEHPEFEKAPSQMLQCVAKRVWKIIQGVIDRGDDDLYDFNVDFEINTMEFPDPKAIKIDGNTVILPKMGDLGPMRFKPHGRPLPEGPGYTLKMCRVKKVKTSWIIDFVYGFEEEGVDLPDDSRTEVGMDLGLKKLGTLSNGQTYEHIRFRKEAKEIEDLQKKRDEYEPGTPEYGKYVQRIANRFKHIADHRLNYLRHVAKDMVGKYRTIVCEDIDIKRLIQDEEYKGIRRSQYSASWGILIKCLNLAAEKAGTEIIKVDPRMTSQICSGCGQIVQKDLSVRVHECPHCGLVMDRDLNASINILRRGGRGLSVNRGTSPVATEWITNTVV